MSDKSRNEQVVRWARFILDNPDKWRKQHDEFIDSQVINSNEVYDKLRMLPNGEDIIFKLRKLRFFGIRD